MARPCKSVSTRTGHMTEEEIENRKEAEAELRGNNDKIKPRASLSKTQKKIFKDIVKELEASGILGNLDIYILETTCICIDRIRTIEDLINEDSNLLMDKTLMATKDKYQKDFFRCCNELSLSPASRAKIGNLNVQAQSVADDALLKALRGED